MSRVEASSDLLEALDGVEVDGIGARFDLLRAIVVLCPCLVASWAEAGRLLRLLLIREGVLIRRIAVEEPFLDIGSLDDLLVRLFLHIWPHLFWQVLPLHAPNVDVNIFSLKLFVVFLTTSERRLIANQFSN